MPVIQTYRDGCYAWRCEDCSRPRLEMAHRGPRKSVCKACQNKRYRRLRGDALRERNRYRMRLRRTGPGRTGQVGTIAGPEQRCYPFRARPGLWNGRAGSVTAGVATPTGIVPPAGPALRVLYPPGRTDKGPLLQGCGVVHSRERCCDGRTQTELFRTPSSGPSVSAKDPARKGP